MLNTQILLVLDLKCNHDYHSSDIINQDRNLQMFFKLLGKPTHFTPHSRKKKKQKTL